MEYDDHGRVYRATNLIDYLASSTVYNAIVSAYYEYNNDGTLKYEKTSLPSGGSIRTDYEYDDFLRVTGMSRTSGSFSQNISYIYYSQNNNTTGLISGYTSTVNGNQIGFSYAYDSKGNITTIVDPNNDVTTYTYDDLGQLLSEVKGNVTKTYTYDNAGNITSITTRTERQPLDPDPGFKPIIKAAGTVPTVVTTTKTLSYSDSQWGDLLTSFDGHSITYDEIGNPLSYYNGTDYTFTWNGRRLVGAVSGSKTMSFEYNDEGIRTSKTVNGVETTYYVNGGQIVAESNNSRTIVYIYDATGAPIGMMYRAPSYAANTWDVFWYEKNLQGDIIAIYNASGTKVATYTYSDAWGNHSVSYSNGGGSTGAQYNPFRYRGYYYDSDLGMYYLQSRYYDAKICRFLNADIYVSTGQGIIGFNMFAYCRNQSPTRVDDEGTVDQDCVSEDNDLLDESWEDGKGAGGSAGPSWSGSGGSTGTTSSGSGGSTGTTSSGSGSHGAAGTGYSSFSAFKSAQGSAGEGYQWHHIVEQCQIKKSNFSANDIHNTHNIIRIDNSTHGKISGHYSSKTDYTNGMTVRDWLAGKPYQVQYEYGMSVINKMKGK